MKKLFKLNKSVSLIILSSVFCVLLTVSLLLNINLSAHALGFSQKEGFQIEENYYCEKDNMTGLRVSSSKNNEEYTLFDEMSGDFYFNFRALSSDPDVADFTNVTFKITDLETNISLDFMFGFYQDSSGNNFGLSTKFDKEDRVVAKYRRLPNKTYGVFGEGLNTNGNMLGAKFSVDDYKLYYYNPTTKKYVSILNNTINSFEGLSYMRSSMMNVPDFERYSLKVSFSGIINSAKPASVVLYSVNGQSLDNVNSMGPVGYGSANLNNGVVNKPYQLDLSGLKTFDVLDGVKNDISDMVTVFGPGNINCQITDGKFTPTIAGEYYLSFAPVDSNGISGEEKTYYFTVFDKEPSLDIILSHNLKDCTLGVGTQLYLPSACAFSGLTHEGKEPTLSLNIYKSDDTIFNTYNANVVNRVSFTESGTYRVVYKASSILGTEKTISANINVSSDIASFNVDSVIEETYARYSKVSFPDAIVESSIADFTLVFPSQATTTSKTITLDEVGEYSIIYKYNNTSYEIPFSVKNTPASLFENINKTTIENYSLNPDYAPDELHGVKISGSSEGSSARFRNQINMTKYEKGDILFKYLIAPETSNNPDFLQLNFMLTDSEDPSVYVELKVITKSDGEKQNSDTYVRTNKMSDFVKCIPVTSSFYGAFTHSVARVGTYPANYTAFSYDYETQTLFGSYIDSVKYWRSIINLRDESIVGTGKRFEGFPSGYAHLSFTFSQVKSRTANVRFYEVDGQDLTQEFISDNTCPDILVDFGEYNEESLPIGIVNKKYPFFNAKSVDLVDGILKTKLDVFYVNADNSLSKLYNYTDSYFVPDKNGEYILSYSTIDSENNYAKRMVRINVVDSLPELSYNTDINSIGKSMIEFIIPDGTAAGGSGNIKVTKTLYYGNVSDGNVIEFKNGIFIPKDAGDYRLVVELEDYIGNSLKKEYAIEIQINDSAILVEKEVPIAIFANKEFTFAKWTALDYSTGKENEIPVILYIDNVKCDEWKWTPETVGKHTLRFVANNGYRESEIIKEIDVVSSNNSNFMSNYFYLENAELYENSKSSYPVKVNGNDSKIFFMNPLSVYALDVQFNVDKVKNNFGGFKVIFTDTINKEQELVLEVIKLNKRQTISNLRINGGELLILNTTFYDNSSENFKFKYDYNNYGIYEGNELLGYAVNPDGSAWAGFESGYVYMTIEFFDVTGDSVFEIKNIGLDTIKANTKSDLIAPHVINDSIDKALRYNETVEFAPAKVYDVLSDVKEFSLTIISPSGVNLLNKVDASKKQSIEVNEYGAYVLKYVAVDTNNKVRELTFELNCWYETELDIEVGEMMTTATVGQTYELPSISTTSSNNVQIHVSLINDDGTRVEIKDNKVTFTQKGKNRIVITAYDKYCNSSVKIYEVEVK